MDLTKRELEILGYLNKVPSAGKNYLIQLFFNRISNGKQPIIHLIFCKLISKISDDELSITKKGRLALITKTFDIDADDGYYVPEWIKK
jgi:hypothetical protein